MPEKMRLCTHFAGRVPKTYVKKLSLADVKPGTPLGTSAVKGPDGKLTATRVQVTKDGVRPPQ